jgi:hypothetical protein
VTIAEAVLSDRDRDKSSYRSFRAFYYRNGKKAGVYTYRGMSWRYSES